MAKVKEISVSFSYKRQTVQFESMFGQADVTLVLEENDKADDVYKQAWSMVKEQVRNQLFTSKEEE